jgi:hypothetical protein
VRISYLTGSCIGEGLKVTVTGVVRERLWDFENIYIYLYIYVYIYIYIYIYIIYIYINIYIYLQNPDLSTQAQEDSRSKTQFSVSKRKEVREKRERGTRGGAQMDRGRECRTHLAECGIFMPVIASTSGRLHSEFVRLLFLQAHRETDRFFAASGVQLA